MIKDKPHPYLKWFFNLIEFIICRHFSKVSFIGEVKPSQDKATLILMNHFSFNDGGIIHRFCRKILKKEFKVMVIEAQMKAFSILKYGGCFSVNKKSRTLVHSLNYAASLLNNKRNMLAIFPQGEVFSFHLNKVHFESGLAKILSKKDKEIQLVFVVTLLDYLDSFKPHAKVYYQEYKGNEDLKTLEDAYNVFYKSCKLTQQRQHQPPIEVLDGF
jgi:1-acyl-sn-glycerol-3-phosphate acyltransferase